jgi:hypothetical protein
MFALFTIISVGTLIFISFKIGGLKNTLTNEGLFPGGRSITSKRLKVAELNAKGDEIILKKIILLKKYLLLHRVISTVVFVVYAWNIAMANAK